MNPGMNYGPLMIDLAGPELEAQEAELLQHPRVGGVILFARNAGPPAQVAALVAAIRRCREGLLVAVDQEGGRVQRLREGFTCLPPLARLGQLYTRAPQQALALARDTGWLMAIELREVGVDLSFAPVLDLGASNEEVIGDRAFAPDPEAVGQLGEAWVQGMREAGMAATGKHFPGHGSVRGDSHEMLPQDPRPLADIMASDLQPFARLIRAGLPAVMAAHVVYPQVDPLPASFSRRWLQEVLRGQFGFEGAVFCDDLCMAGASGVGDMLARAEAALAAGCDMLPVCNDREAVVNLLDRWHPRHSTSAARKRLQAMRGQAWHVDADRHRRVTSAISQLETLA